MIGATNGATRTRVHEYELVRVDPFEGGLIALAQRLVKLLKHLPQFPLHFGNSVGIGWRLRRRHW
jgi:hypothetical protein